MRLGERSCWSPERRVASAARSPLGCAGAGADLALTYRRKRSGAEDTAGGSGRWAGEPKCCGSTSAGEEESNARRRVGERFGRLDVWINNAGADILTGEGGRLSRQQKLDCVLEVDLRGTVLASWAAVELMRRARRRVIINMSWDHVLPGMAGENPGLYSAAKGGIASFSKSLARDVAPRSG